MSCGRILSVFSFSLLYSIHIFSMEKDSNKSLNTLKSIIQTNQISPCNVLKFGEDKNNQLMSITPKEIYEVGNEDDESIKKLSRRDTSLWYSRATVIKNGIIYEEPQCTFIYPSGNNEKYLRLKHKFSLDYDIKLFENDQSKGPICKANLIFKNGVLKKAFINEAGSIIALVSGINPGSYVGFYGIFDELPISSNECYHSEVQVLESDEKINALVFNKKSTLVIIGVGKNIVMYDIKAKKKTFTLQKMNVEFPENKNCIESMLFTPNEKYFISAAGLAIMVYDFVTRDCIVRLSGANYQIKELGIGTHKQYGQIIAALGTEHDEERSEVTLWVCPDKWWMFNQDVFKKALLTSFNTKKLSDLFFEFE